jgi:hypothetical protein
MGSADVHHGEVVLVATVVDLDRSGKRERIEPWSSR